MVIHRHLNTCLLPVLILVLSSHPSHAGLADTLHLADDYPECSFSPVDAQTGTTVRDVYAVAEWYKNVTIMEYAAEACRKSYKVHFSVPTFSIPAATCSGYRLGTTLEVRVKAPGYHMKAFRILRRPTGSDHFPNVTYLSIDMCGKTIQQLPLIKIQSFDGALKQYEDTYNRGRIRGVFSDNDSYQEMMLSELKSFDPSLDAAGAKKAYCEAVLKNTPHNLRSRWEAYCTD